MSEEALKGYEKAIDEQHGRNEARRIRARVAEARGNPHPAGQRWPFELLQNALDAGPRANKLSIDIGLRREVSGLVFEHDAVPFTFQDLAALLSGGSNKEFDSDLTTGRFGTGFLVTHVLAEHANLQGLLKVPGGEEQFTLSLDRSGDEESILANIRSCNEAIRSAKPVVSIDTIPSARFDYPTEDSTPIDQGIVALRQSLPYLYATRPTLGCITLDLTKDIKEVWIPNDIYGELFGTGYVERRCIQVHQNGSEPTEIIVYKFMGQRDSSASSLVLVKRTETGFKVHLPEKDAPRLYREYPVLGSGFLPVSLILNGKFEPDQERRRLLMSDTDKVLIKESFTSAVLAVKFAFDQNWEGAHMLAQASRPMTCFDPTDTSEKDWWTQQLGEFAQALSKLPIVKCTIGDLPAIVDAEDGSSFANFIVPRLLPTSTEDETTVQRMWPVVSTCTELCPPREELAIDWTATAEGWHGLGVNVSLVTVKDLADSVRNEAKFLNDFKMEGDKKDWLASFLDIVGECWQKREGTDLEVLSGMLPDQNERLCSPDSLSRDIGISDKLKAICLSVGMDIRGRLLLGGLAEIANAKGLVFVLETIACAIPRTLSENQIIEDLVKYLSGRLPEDKDCEGGSEPAQKGTVQLLSYLWETKTKDATSIAQRVPLITSKQRAVRWSQNRMMMSPVCCWEKSAQPFFEAYPPHRVLARLYAGFPEEGITSCVPALVQWGMAIADPITTDIPVELTGRRLGALGHKSKEEEKEGVTVRGEKFSQIALLDPEVLNRCQEGREEARALLGLVLCYVASHDHSWEDARIVKGRKSGKDVAITVNGALWLADLRFRAWVPVPGEDGKPAKMIANRTTLEGLILDNPEWLKDNGDAIRLLTEWFEFDELDLRLLGITPAECQKIRSGLAKLVESGGSDPSFYSKLLEEVEAQKRRSRDVDRCRKLGLAVQAAVKLAMENYALKLDFIDRGFDYTVDLQAGNVLEDGATNFEMGPYLLEVKSTTRGEARLTPLQAETASKESPRFVLCVVDLRGLSDVDLDVDWTAAMVEPLAKIMTNVGAKAAETYSLVQLATTKSVSIKNETALRYEVPVAVWESGVTISEWVKKVSSSQR